MNKFQSIKLNFIVFTGVLLLLASCKSVKTGSITSISKKNTAKEIVLAHSSKEFKFNTLQSRLKVTYSDGKKTFSPSVTLRMEKDKKIWMSVKVLGITMAKVYITPTSVSFYEKLTKKSYDGDFKALSTFLGTDVSFNMLQNLITGQSIMPLQESFSVNHSSENKTQLAPNPQNELYTLLVSLYNLNIKVANVKLKQGDDTLQIEYKEYQKIETQDFPKTVYINAASDLEIKKIDMEFKSVNLNESLTFPFAIPEGYNAFLIE